MKIVAGCIVSILTLSLSGGPVFGLDLIQTEALLRLGRAAILPQITISEHASLALFGMSLWLLASNSRRRQARQE